MSGRLFYAHHALQRMNEMDVSKADIQNCIEEASVSYRTVKDGNDRSLFKCDEVTVIIQHHDDREDTVVSVLWNTTEEYERPKETV